MTTKYVAPSGSDSNNGDSISTPYLTIDKAFDNLAAGDGIVWLADGDYNQTTNLVTSGGTATGSITLKSISGNPDACFISGNETATTWYLLRNDETNVDLIVDGVGFKNAHFTAENASCALFWSDQDLTLINSRFDNLTSTMESLQPTGFIRNYHGTNPANLTIAGLKVRNCTVDWSGGTGYEGALWSTNQFGGIGTFSDIDIDGFNITTDSNYQFNSVMFHRGTSHFSGINSLKNITINCANACYGLIKLESLASGYAHTISGKMTIDNVDVTCTTANGHFYGLIQVSSTDSLTITADIEVMNCALEVPVGRTNVGVISSVHASSSLIIKGAITGHDNSATVGGALVSNYGGGGATISRVSAYNNAFESASISIISLGGTTDIYGCNIHDNVSVFGGGGIRCEPASGTNIININNVAVYDNTSTGSGDGIALNEPLAITATYNINNSKIRNGASDNISIGGAGTPVVNIYTSNIEGGDPGADVYTDCFDSAIESDNYGIGAKWWTGANPIGADGEPFSDLYTDIGYNQSKHNKFHPRNL